MSLVTNLLTWQVVLRPGTDAPDPGLPSSVLTVAPGFMDDRVPAEASLLLPNCPGNDAFLATLARLPSLPREAAAGLFLADPFLVPVQAARRLTAAGIAWVCNLPSCTQQDAGFLAQLGDVGLDHDREVAGLAAFSGAGCRTLAVVVDAPGARRAMEIRPDAVLVMPPVSDFAAGFPSFRQRGSAITQICEAIGDSGWGGAVLGLATQGEAGHASIWPPQLAGVVVRPVAFSPEARSG